MFGSFHWASTRCSVTSTPNTGFEEAAPLLWFYPCVLGVVAAAVGYLYARTFYGTVKLTARLPGGIVLWPTIGGLMVGLLALAVPQVLSSGYGWVQLATTKQGLLTIPLWIVLLLPIAKIVATSLSIGTGGSGGLFGPGIVIGAFRRRHPALLAAGRHVSSAGRAARRPEHLRRGGG